VSHFTVIIELPASTEVENYAAELERRLARYDEELVVEPYRDYWESTDPRSHWSFEHVYDSDAMRTVAPGVAAEDITLAQFVDAYNARYNSDPSESRAQVDAESGRVYQMSVSNPDAKWDWWTIGGRWRGHFIAVEKMSSDDAQLVLLSESAWMNENLTLAERACDGGPIRLLDFDAMRADAVRKAEERCATYERAIEGTPDAISWSDMLAAHDDVDEARERYREQPRVQALAAAFDKFSFGCKIDEFKWGRDIYVERARLSAVPGYAYLTYDDEWLSPGDMGWFGLSSDTVESREAYDVAVNGRIASVDPNTVIVLVDCHI